MQRIAFMRPLCEKSQAPWARVLMIIYTDQYLMWPIWNGKLS